MLDLERAPAPMLVPDSRRAADGGRGMSRTLGRSGIKVSDIGFGCWAIGGPFTGRQARRLGRGR